MKIKEIVGNMKSLISRKNDLAELEIEEKGRSL